MPNREEFPNKKEDEKTYTGKMQVDEKTGLVLTPEQLEEQDRERREKMKAGDSWREQE